MCLPCVVLVAVVWDSSHAPAATFRDQPPSELESKRGRKMGKGTFRCLPTLDWARLAWLCMVLSMSALSHESHVVH